MLQSLNMTAHMYSDHIFHYWVLFLVKSSLLPDLDEPDGKSVYTVVWEEQYIHFFAPPLAWAKISLLYLVIIKTIWSAYAKEQILYIYISPQYAMIGIYASSVKRPRRKSRQCN